MRLVTDTLSEFEKRPLAYRRPLRLSIRSPRTDPLTVFEGDPSRVSFKASKVFKGMDSKTIGG